MNLYQIDQMIMSLVDEETGEVKDFEEFEKLALAKEEKIENTACLVVNLRAEANAIKAQRDVLNKRATALTNRADRLEEYLAQFLDGESYKSARVTVKWSGSERCICDPEKTDEIIQWALENGHEEFVKVTAPTVAVNEIKKGIKSGIEVPYAVIEKCQNIQIK